MKRFRVFLACLICRTARAVLRLLGRGGTAMPGKIALKVYPGLLAELGRGVETVVITGTNGKTTTSGMLRHMLDTAGQAYLSNRSGANLTSGITAEFVTNATIFGRPSRPLAIIESDEGNFPAVCAALQPKVILVTNLFRDQLDRYGEVTHTRDYLARGIATASDAVLCLNADCSLTASLGRGVPNRVVYYGVDGVSSDREPGVSDAPHCISCGERYAYRRHTFAHLGDWYCPRCGLSRPDPDVAAQAVEPTAGGSSVRLRTPDGLREITVALPALYNVYNALAAIAAARSMGWDPDECCDSLADFGAMFGRMESLTVGDTSVQIVLVKNPAGCDRALEYLATRGDDVLPIFCLNDNLNDGTDVSWIWDADYETLFARRHYERIGVFGLRAGDMRLRLKYAGADDGTIAVYDTLDDLADAVRNAGKPVCVLPNYTSMLAVRDKLSALAGGGKFWEAN
ncbi:MAG: DUF1727 domain-containing protein [Oscillospiraceae bacterium]|nr:DUF1727 domain-containing protein [Oscillospiraceae bacterium]